MELIHFGVKVFIVMLAAQFVLARLVEWVAREIHLLDIRRIQRDDLRRAQERREESKK